MKCEICGYLLMPSGTCPNSKCPTRTGNYPDATVGSTTGSLSPKDDRAFSQFVREVEEAMTKTARDKGYGTSPDDPNPLFELTGPTHAIGEIIYKAIRYRDGKHDPMELIKIAAWAFLVWRHR